MNLSDASPIVQSARPALELISLAGLSPERARQNLRASLLVNPNYFGKITADSFKAVLNIHKDTTFENIDVLVYDSRSEQLQARVNINRCSGYSSESHKYGSEEFVRFYLSIDGGASWKDHGLRAVNVFDRTGPKPLQFSVSVSTGPLQTHCFIECPPLARAILSWNSPPPEDSPDWTPVWGNVRNAQIQVTDSSNADSRPLVDQTELKSPEEMTQSSCLEQCQCVDTALKQALRTADSSKPARGLNLLSESDLMSSLFFPTALFPPPDRPLTLLSRTGLCASLSQPVRTLGALSKHFCRQLPPGPRRRRRHRVS